jgi:hypothetical protein
MSPRWFALLLAVLASASVSGLAGDCAQVARKANLDLSSTRSLLSPDGQWRFIGIGPKSAESGARLYIKNLHTGQQWKVGSIGRDATAFWSGDSRCLFLRDEYAADDTNIRVFDLTTKTPKEILDLDRSIRKDIFRHIPTDETTLWIYYPQVCFAATSSSTILLTADAPRVPMAVSGPGKTLEMRLAVDLATLKVKELWVRKER